MSLMGNQIKIAALTISGTNPSSKFAKDIFLRKEDFVEALSTTDFYIQFFVICIALTLAWLSTIIIDRRVREYFKLRPPTRIDVEFFTKPLALLLPVVAMLYLGITRPLLGDMTADASWMEATMQLCFAYFMARCVLLMVKTRPVANFIAFIIMLVAALRVSGFTSFTVAYLNSLSIEIGQYHISMLNLFHGIVILVIVFWIAGLLSRTLESYLRRSSSLSYMARELTVKFFNIFIYFLALIITLSSIGVDLTAFAVFGGALGVGIGLGLQKITANFVSGITLLLEKSIRIGDLIEVAGNTGWVRQLNIRYALIETSDGREVMIPNEELISTRVTNWTHTTNTARVDIKVNVAYYNDPRKVHEVLISAAKSHPLCLKNPAPSCHLREFGDNAMQFLLIFWIPDVHDGRMAPQSEVMIAVWDKFREAGIGIPTPASQNQVQNLPEKAD